MEPPEGVLASLWQFLRFLPFFTGLLLLGFVKGITFCPLICLIISTCNVGIILCLFPVHVIWTYYCILSSKQLGPVLKLFLCLCLPAAAVLWLVIGISGNVLGGFLYGFLSPIFATFDAVGEGKSDPLFHCFYDGTWSTIRGSFTVVRDFKDVCFLTYFSLMDDLREGQRYYEIRILYLPGALVAAVLGIIVNFPVISIIALFKSPYMLFKGWRRLLHDLVGREGPFLETICVPIAGLVILLWPLAVVGAVLGSVVSSVFLGAYAGVVVYQESSFWFGLCYVIAAISIYDEYSNDILDMSEGSCFPRPRFRKLVEKESMRGISGGGSFSRPNSFKSTPSRSGSIGGQMIDLKPLELLQNWFMECKQHGDRLVAEGVITPDDIKEADSKKASRVVGVGLPAYCLLQVLIRSAKANSMGILLDDSNTEITSKNRPKDAFFDWFLNPFLILKDQIKAAKLSEEEEEYLGKLVLFSGDPERLKSSNLGPPPQSEVKRAELDGFARRLRGITKSISRYPTFWRHFENLVKGLSADLENKYGSQTLRRSKSYPHTQKSFKRKSSMNGSDEDSQPSIVRAVDIA